MTSMLYRETTLETYLDLFRLYLDLFRLIQAYLDYFWLPLKGISSTKRDGFNQGQWFQLQ